MRHRPKRTRNGNDSLRRRIRTLIVGESGADANNSDSETEAKNNSTVQKSSGRSSEAAVIMPTPHFRERNAPVAFTERTGQTQTEDRTNTEESGEFTFAREEAGEDGDTNLRCPAPARLVKQCSRIKIIRSIFKIHKGRGKSPRPDTLSFSHFSVKRHSSTSETAAHVFVTAEQPLPSIIQPRAFASHSPTKSGRANSVLRSRSHEAHCYSMAQLLKRSTQTQEQDFSTAVEQLVTPRRIATRLNALREMLSEPRRAALSRQVVA